MTLDELLDGAQLVATVRKGDTLVVGLSCRLDAESAARLRERFQLYVPGQEVVFVDQCVAMAIVEG